MGDRYGDQMKQRPNLLDAAGVYPGDDAPPETSGTGETSCAECRGTGRIAHRDCPNGGGSGTLIKGIAGG